MQQSVVPSISVLRIGSRTRAIGRVAVLLLSIICALVLLYWWLTKITSDVPFVLILIVVLTILRRTMDRSAREGWAKFITEDAAYGRVTESGIEYRTLFRRHFASWRQIERLEYIEDSGRISVYLCGKKVPVQFAPHKGQLPPAGWPSIPDVLRQHLQLSCSDFAVTEGTNTLDTIKPRHESALRLATMTFVGLALLVALFQLIERWVGNSVVALSLLLGGLVMALFEPLLFGRIPRWIDYVMKDVRNLRAR